MKDMQDFEEHSQMAEEDQQDPKRKKDQFNYKLNH